MDFGSGDVLGNEDLLVKLPLFDRGVVEGAFCCGPQQMNHIR